MNRQEEENKDEHEFNGGRFRGVMANPAPSHNPHDNSIDINCGDKSFQSQEAHPSSHFENAAKIESAREPRDIRR